jgi:predicted permease
MRGLFTRRRVDEDFQQELDSHLALLTEENIRRGMMPDEARRAAGVRLGGVTQLRESHREAWGWPMMEAFLQDLRYAFRTLRKSPGFTMTVVLTLALGIGANTAIFSLIDVVMLRDLPVRDPGSLVFFSDNPSEGMSVGSGLSADGRWREFSYPLYQDLARPNRLMQGICAFQSGEDSFAVRFKGQSRGTATEVVVGKLVSGNYFSVLGVSAVAGRLLTPADDQADAPPAAVASFNYWKAKLGGDPAVAGRTLDIDGVSTTLVGIAPPGFFGERVEQDSADIWLPLSLRPRFSVTALPLAARDLADPHTAWLDLAGRLKPGVSMAQANAEIDGDLRQYLGGLLGPRISASEAQQLQHQYVTLAPGGRGLSQMRHQYSRPLNILLGIVGLVLLIACANVANLLLSRATVRQKEMAMRLALGATRSRLVRQTLAECLLLAVLGGAMGALLARWGVNVLISLVAERVPLNVRPSLAVLGFTVAVSLLTAFLSGLAPALRSTRAGLFPALKSGSWMTGSSQAKLGLDRTLVVAQIALSLLLLIGAGLLVRSLANLEDQKLGFSPEHVLLVSVDPTLAGCQPKQLPGLYRALLDRIGAVPGVRSVSVGSESPMSGGESYADVMFEGEPRRSNEGVRVVLASPHYFETEGMPIVAGRDISLQDTTTSVPVAVVNQAFVRRFLANRNPIGRRFFLQSSFEPPGLEIAGVVGDARYSSPAESPEPAVFLPADQQAEVFTSYADEIQVLASGNPSGLAAEVKGAIQKVDLNLPITGVTTLGRQVRDSFSQQRTITGVTACFGFLGLALACVGLYGIMAYSVARRSNEIGIRMALGASRSNVFTLVVGRSMRLTAIGVAAGILAALALTRLLSSLLYVVKPVDPLTFIVVSLLLISVAALASYIPARRATKVDPMVALRYE